MSRDHSLYTLAFLPPPSATTLANKRLTIRVKTLTGLMFPCVVPSAKVTVQDLKRELFRELHLPVHGQELIHRGTRLDNAASLQSLGCRDNDFMVLIMNKKRYRESVKDNCATVPGATSELGPPKSRRVAAFDDAPLGTATSFRCGEANVLSVIESLITHY